MAFSSDTLPNGLTVLTESVPDARSVAIGCFVRCGSRDETPAVSGVSHFLEHMAFKGDETRDADAMNRLFDDLGARYNASTGEEVTTYYANVLPEYLEPATDLVTTLIRPTLREEDFRTEKQVILEEIGMYADQPGFFAYDEAMGVHFDGHPLGRSILGTTESIGGLGLGQMIDYHAARYSAGAVTFVAAGNCDRERIVDLATRHCGDWPAADVDRPLPPHEPAGRTVVLPHDTTLQQYVVAMASAPPADDPRRLAAELVAVAVGDDSGSRLYWDLVDPGHAEAAELGYNEYEGVGTWMTYLSGEPDATVTNIERLRTVFDRVNADGLTAAELDRAKSKAAARLVLRAERPMGRLSAIAGNWIYRREYLSVAEEIATVRAVTVDDVRALLDAFPLAMTTTVGVGPLSSL
ncbi:MAG: pitrilysin family protein [Planctomycetota bacterium]